MGTTWFRGAVSAVLLFGTALPPLAASADGAGAYLAGRQAVYQSDFDTAARYYTRALVADPANPQLMENVALSNLAIGRLDTALPVAQRMEAQGLRSQIASMIAVAGLVRGGDYSGILARDPRTHGIGPLVDGLVAAWAHVGVEDMEAALAAFDRVANEDGLHGFALYHKGLALALTGDLETAATLFADPVAARVMSTRRGAMARAEILSQLGRNEAAIDTLVDAFGPGFDPGLTALADRLAAGETLPFTHATSVADGMAEVFYSVGAALSGEASADYALIYTRTAQALRPDHVDAILMTARFLEDLEQYDLAVAAYRKIPAGSPDHHAAELGRAESLRRSGKPDAAIEVLDQLVRAQPELAAVRSALGDLQRQQEDYAAAVDSYTSALDLTEEGARNAWFLYYARGICHERMGAWDEAEADFRAALALNPDQPQVLNYLGYSLVEKQIKLDEALDMIQRAVAARPDSGYIVDSLGWVLYRLGRYDEAVEHMEHAVRLMPVDPVVNDHLGDVYWATGRHREAEFQWKRALSFIDPDDTDGEADPVRIRRKLEVGLDAVLAEEGAPPLKVANDDG